MPWKSTRYRKIPAKDNRLQLHHHPNSSTGTAQLPQPCTSTAPQWCPCWGLAADRQLEWEMPQGIYCPKEATPTCPAQPAPSWESWGCSRAASPKTPVVDHCVTAQTKACHSNPEGSWHCSYFYNAVKAEFSGCFPTPNTNPGLWEAVSLEPFTEEKAIFKECFLSSLQGMVAKRILSCRGWI